MLAYSYRASAPALDTIERRGKVKAAYNRLSSHNRKIGTIGSDNVVIYHETAIVQWNANTITLRTGGWDSVTTRKSMNQTSLQFGLGFSVWREKGVTYVLQGDLLNGIKQELEDGMVLSRAGKGY